jgi:hypothetical protein
VYHIISLKKAIVRIVEHMYPVKVYNENLSMKRLKLSLFSHAQFNKAKIIITQFVSADKDYDYFP